MMFNESKCQFLYPGRDNLGITYRRGDETLESSPAERGSGALVDRKLNVSQQCTQAAREVNCTLGCTKHGIPSQSREVTVLLYTALEQPHTDNCVKF